VAEVTISAGGLDFKIEYRTFGGDRGAAIRVFGDVDGTDTQLLRFDCFDNAPHYHYAPDGMNAHHHMDRAVTPDVVAYSLAQIRDNTKAMVKAAGYPEVAASVDSEAVANSVGAMRAEIEKATAEAAAA
jgi:hypothetical protein